MRFVLIDKTAGATASDGSALTPDVLLKIAAACQVQANRDLAAYWGVPIGCTVTVGDGTSLQKGDIPFVILPTLPNAPGAVAYHDVDGNGLPVLFDAITMSDTLMGTGNSLSIAISHEICEALVDGPCNRWADSGTGKEYAEEACDPVQSTSYDLGGVQVSDFVTPAYFDPNSSGPFDYCEILTAPFTNANGGYQIERNSGTGETQVQGKIPASRVAKKMHPMSRTARRIAA